MLPLVRHIHYVCEARNATHVIISPLGNSRIAEDFRKGTAFSRAVSAVETVNMARLKAVPFPKAAMPRYNAWVILEISVRGYSPHEIFADCSERAARPRPHPGGLVLDGL
jgi:hypothetical protein